MKEIDESNFRIYLLSLGFLAYQSGIDLTTFVANEAESTLPGVFFENYVSNELKTSGFPLFYWKGKGGSEFEFLIEEKGSVAPIGVKKKGGSLKSLAKYKERNAYSKAIKISTKNLGYDAEAKILTVPLYMVFALLRKIRNEKDANLAL